MASHRRCRVCRPSCRRRSRRPGRSPFSSAHRDRGTIRFAAYVRRYCCHLVAEVVAARGRDCRRLVAVRCPLSPPLSPDAVVAGAGARFAPHCGSFSDSLIPLRIALRQRISSEGVACVFIVRSRIYAALAFCDASSWANPIQRRTDPLFWRETALARRFAVRECPPRARAETKRDSPHPFISLDGGRRRCQASRSHLLTTISCGMSAAPISATRRSTASICCSRWSLAPSTT